VLLTVITLPSNIAPRYGLLLAEVSEQRAGPIFEKYNECGVNVNVEFTIV
jgi:hypothetical protein